MDLETVQTALLNALPALAATLAPILVMAAKLGMAQLGTRIPDTAKVVLNVFGGVVLASLVQAVTGATMTGDPATDGMLGALFGNKVRDLRTPS